MVDLDRLESNLAAMAARAGALGVALRPHVKTHKCVEIARRQRELGARGLTVSTLEEARVFAEHGFDDLTWAVPVPRSRLAEAVEIARRITLRLVVDSPEALAWAAEAAAGARLRLHLWLKVDAGYHRAGVDPASGLAERLVRAIHASPHLVFDGLLSHSGQAYRARSRAEAARAAEEERSAMADLARRLRDAGCEVPEVSVGSTPGMAAAEHLEGATEARPGNYAFYDFTQVAIGSCGPADCALTVLATVVSCQPGADHAVVDAGALSLSKDPGPDWIEPPTMGELIEYEAAGSPSRDASEGEDRKVAGTLRTLRSAVRLTSLSQEHGIASAPLPVGSRVRILPNHACLAAACFDTLHVVRGDRLVDRWRIRRAR